MLKAKIGDTVEVHYTGRLDDNNVFDSSYNKSPIKFLLGEKKLIREFEEAVIGMQPGETKNITIKSENAYGPVYQHLIIQVERAQIPADVRPEIGNILHFKHKVEGEERAMALSVIGVTDTHLTLDANHPLAGRDLHFEIELVKIF